MAGLLPGDPSHHGMVDGVSYSVTHDRQEEPDRYGFSWYMSRKEIEENSPSRRDGIDLKKETYLRKSYCTFLQDLGMRLKVPQVTIATAIIFCHRFFLRQSHAKNDRRTIATVCMFLAGKVEETPRPIKDVILVSYDIIHKKDPAAVQRIKQREVYEQQKELILLGERVLLVTLGFDLNVHHPYKPLVEAIKKFKVAQNALAQVAWNFVNDGLRTSLCLQFKPHHIAAGAIFLAAKFLKVKLPSDGEKVWWQEFDVTPRQLEEVSNQMLELYEQNRAAAPSHGNETEGNSGGASSHRGPVITSVSVEESAAQNGCSQSIGTIAVKPSVLTTSSRSVTDQSHADKPNGSQIAQNESNERGGKESRNATWDQNLNAGSKDRRHFEQGNIVVSSNSKLSHGSERPVEDLGRPDAVGRNEIKEWNSGTVDGTKDYSPMDAIKKIDKDKVKAALEKRRKSRSDVARKMDLMDEDDLIERELESGVELAVEDEKIKQERKNGWSKHSHRQEPSNSNYGMENGDHRAEPGMDNPEEGELSYDNHASSHSPEPGSRKRKAESPVIQIEGKDGYDFQRHHIPYSKHQDFLEDGGGIGRHDRGERDYKRY